MTFRVLVADKLAAEGVEVLREHADLIEVEDTGGIDREGLLRKVAKVDALVIRSASQVDQEVLDAATKLQVVGRAGIGVDNVDVEAATRSGVVVMNTPEGNATTTAEHSLSLMMSMARCVPQASASMKEGRWDKKKFMGTELSGKSLGVIGLGNIGRLVAERALGLKMRVLGADPFFAKETAQKLGIDLVPLPELLKRADVVTVHTPLNDETRGMIGDAEIDLMKPGVMLINCARGGVYDEDALLRGLEQGKLAGVALDVYVQEPPAKDHPLVNHPKVVCTPHLGASTKEAQRQVAIDVAQQIVDFAKGRGARNAVNLPRLSTSDREKIEPYLRLAEQLGACCAQIQQGSVRRVEVNFRGTIADGPTGPITSAVVAGVLRSTFEAAVNLVNGRYIAQERGIEVLETCSAGSDQDTYANTIAVRIEGDEAHRVVGTLYEDGGRLIEVDGVRVEAVPQGHILLVENNNRPGVVGRIGGVLGEAGINISRMQLGLDAATGRALSLVNVDQAVPDTVLTELATGDVLSVRRIAL